MESYGLTGDPGLDAAALERALAVVGDAVSAGAIPGAVAAVAQPGREVALRAYGRAQIVPHERAMSLGTCFDLASLTKPVATATTFLTLVDEGRISLDAPAGQVLPELAGDGKEAVTFRRLLTHSSGLPGWRPTYAYCRSMDEAVAYIGSLPLAYPPGTGVQYSCLGFILLGAAIRRLTGMPLDAAVRQRLIRPAGMETAGFGPRTDDVAATEADNAYERAMLARAGVRFDGWRTGMICGAAQDGNAFYTQGGISGNAGLFGTALDLVRYGLMLLNGGRSVTGQRVLSPAAVRLMTTDQTPDLPLGRGLGWMIHRGTAPGPADWQVPPSSRDFFPPEMYSAVAAPRPQGELIAPGAFGHTGFTGTSLWIDPTRQLVAVLLTNAAHPQVTPAIGQLRPRFHNALVAACD